MRILIFAGTTEGRELAAILTRAGIETVVSVATEYGGQLMDEMEGMTLLVGRLDREGILSKLKELEPAAVVDATHPFAVKASEEISEAAALAGIKYLRLSRDTGSSFLGDGGIAEAHGSLGESETEGDCNGPVAFPDLQSAVKWLDSGYGNILLMTGSRDIGAIASLISDKSRLFARVLPSLDSIRLCEEAGLKNKQIIAMQGPFSEELNEAMLRSVGAKYLLTKETGKTGGFDEKLIAAHQCGVTPVVIQNPENKIRGEAPRGLSFEEILAEIAKIAQISLNDLNSMDGGGCVQDRHYDKNGKRQGHSRSEYGGEGCQGFREIETDDGVRNGLGEIGDAANGTDSFYLIGLGPGSADYILPAARKALREADIIFGAPRILKALPDEFNNVPKVAEYLSERILSYLDSHRKCRIAAAVFSGDTGFFSGAIPLARALQSRAFGGKVDIICGVSSIVYFASRIGVSWQDARLLSCHGRECNVTGNLRKHGKAFLLVSNVEEVRDIGRRIEKAEKNRIIGKSDIWYGFQLTLEDEKVERVDAGGLQDLKAEGLYVLFIACSNHLRQTELGNQAEPPCEGVSEGQEPFRQIVPGIPDSAFLRGRAPMTKEEIRSISLCKLRLSEDSILYDIGAGTGSVSVEAALICTSGKVYAIEEKSEAYELLTQNKERFCLENLEIVRAKAPEGLDALPAPSAVFIGGSGGKLREILLTVAGKCENKGGNPPYGCRRIRVVLNCVTLETVLQIFGLAEKSQEPLRICETEYVQISVTRSENVGAYHMMKAQNPVFVVSFYVEPVQRI